MAEPAPVTQLNTPGGTPASSKSFAMNTPDHGVNEAGILAKGELPMSLFKGQRNNDRIDFHVDSSTVDLGIIQGLTTAVSGVQGKLQAKLDLTGSALEPRVQGAVTIAGGGFKAEDTGVTYKGIDGKIDFLPDRVHIDDLHVLDHDNDYLTVTGDLGVSGLRFSNVNLGFTQTTSRCSATRWATCTSTATSS